MFVSDLQAEHQKLKFRTNRRRNDHQSRQRRSHRWQDIDIVRRYTSHDIFYTFDLLTHVTAAESSAIPTNRYSNNNNDDDDINNNMI